MTSRQRTGLIVFLLGLILFLSDKLPGFGTYLKEFITFPVVLMIIGVYLIITNNKN